MGWVPGFMVIGLCCDVCAIHSRCSEQSIEPLFTGDTVDL